jgi:hypothetical protein
MSLTRFEPPQWPHIESGLSEELYHAFDAMSASRLKILDRSTSLHLAHTIATPMEGPALTLGRALHSKVLTPHLYGRDFAVAPVCDKRTTAGKATWEAFQATSGSKTVLTADQGQEVDAMARAVAMHPEARSFCQDVPGDPEVSFFAEIAGVKTKARMDRWLTIDNDNIVIDLKTSQAANRKDFEKSIIHFGYGLQCCLYQMIAQACGKKVNHFVFVVVEKAPPYAVAVYRFRDDAAAAFTPRVLELAAQYKQFLVDGPRGYEGVTEIGLPSWAMKNLTEGETNE